MVSDVGQIVAMNAKKRAVDLKIVAHEPFLKFFSHHY